MRRLTALTPTDRGDVLSAFAQLNVDPSRLLAGGNPSPGELRKLLLCLGLRDHPHLIVMDEPTNHLDLHSIQALAHALAGYPGALLLVSRRGIPGVRRIHPLDAAFGRPRRRATNGQLTPP